MYVCPISIEFYELNIFVLGIIDKNVFLYFKFYK